MSARRARAELADARAMEEQAYREDLHGREGLYGAGKYIGAGATPSMGLSQFRGGAMHGGDMEEDYRGGLAMVPFRGRRPVAPVVRPPSTAIIPRPSGALALPGGIRTPAQIRGFWNAFFGPGGPAGPGGQLQLTDATTGAPASATKRSSLIKRILAGVGIIAALAGLGLTIAGATGALGGPGDAGYYPDAGDVPGGDAGPSGGPGGDGGAPSDLSRSELAWYLQSGNLPERYYTGATPRRGAGKAKKAKAPASGRRAERAAIVKRVMQERGVSLPEASRIVKQEGLF